MRMSKQGYLIRKLNKSFKKSPKISSSSTNIWRVKKTTFHVMHLSIASPAPGDPGHGGDHAGTVRERTKNVARLCRGV